MKSRAVIYCKRNTNGRDSFYLESEGERYWLFDQNHRKGVNEHFGKGLFLTDALSHRKAGCDGAVCKTISKLPAYIKYVEKEYGIAVLERTKKRILETGRYGNCA